MERVLSSLPLALLLLVAGVCWWSTVGMAVAFEAPAAQAHWQAAPFAMVFLMWGIMMAAMMLPSFIPTLRTHQHLRQRGSATTATTRTNTALPHQLAFAGGYLLLWLTFSAAAALLQQVAATAGALTPALAIASPAAAAALLAAAGIFQFTPLKMKCLHGCRHPAFFFLLHWKNGVRGAWHMGMHNGLLCLGCCVWLMLLLFVGGVMNLATILLLTLYVLVEKLLPAPPQVIARTAGALLLAAAAWQASPILF